MKIKGIEFSEETIVNALEKAGISLEKPKKEKPKFEPIRIDHLTVGLEQGSRPYIYVRIRENDRNVNYPTEGNGCGCWFDGDEAERIIAALQSALKYRNKKD